jgi:hypothetical protein
MRNISVRILCLPLLLPLLAAHRSQERQMNGRSPVPATPPRSFADARSSRTRASGVAAGAPPVSLRASFEFSPKELKVRLHIANRGEADVLIFNRLWIKSDGKPAPDPEKIYRFVRDSKLRLLLGMAPLPRSKTPLYRNIPFVTRLQPGRTLEEEIRISAPVKEYNVYFPVLDGNPYVPDKVARAEVFAEYLIDSPAIKTQPSSFDPTALKIVSPGSWDAAQLAASGPVPLDLQVLRRTDEFERLTLPGEEL